MKSQPTYNAPHYDYEVEIFCFGCKKRHTSYFDYDEFYMYAKYIERKRKNYYLFNCPYCNKVNKTCEIELKKKILKKGAISNEEYAAAIDAWHQ